jgi:hypothetical protein
MKRNYKYFLILILSIFSCKQLELDYDSLSEEIYNAWQARDQKHMLAIAEKIKERHINGSDGVRLLKLKLTALTFAGKNLEAFNEINTNTRFSNNYEFFTAKGLLAERIEFNAYQYFNSAFELLKKKPQNDISDGEKVLEIYLAIILGKMDIVENDLYQSLSLEGKDIVDYYMQLERTELLTVSPLGFIQDALPQNTNSKEMWWE